MMLHAPITRSFPAPGAVPFRLSGSAGRPPRHDADRREGVDGRPVLIESGPSDLHCSLRPAPRWHNFSHFAFKMDHITWPNGSQPAQLVYANAQQRVRPEGPRVPSQTHSHRRRVPSRGRKAFKRRTLRRSLVKVIRLRVEFRGKAFDVFTGYQFLRALEAHPDTHIVEPFDHCDVSSC